MEVSTLHSSTLQPHNTSGVTAGGPAPSSHRATRTPLLHKQLKMPVVFALVSPNYAYFTVLFQIKLIVKWELVDDQDQMLFCWKIPVQITS